MVAIHNRRPKLMSLTDLLDAYIDHQKDVVTKEQHLIYANQKNVNMFLKG